MSKDKKIDIGLSNDPDHDLFNEENIPPSNWMKFEKVGDKVSGIFVEKRETLEKNNMPAQFVYVLKQKDGTMMNVGISKTKDYVNLRANGARFGDLLGFEFQKEIPATVKGHNPAKSIEVFIKATPQGEVDGVKSE